MAQRTDMTTVASLMRCSWAAVHAMAGRVVAERIDADRLDGLYRIGVDEISYRRGHHYLTIVADHDKAKVVWVAKGKRGAALEGFFDALGEARCEAVQAISMDLLPAPCHSPESGSRPARRAVPKGHAAKRIGLDAGTGAWHHPLLINQAPHPAPTQP